jgi:hypothetical protein
MDPKIALSFSRAFSAYFAAQHTKAADSWGDPPLWTALAADACRSACMTAFGKKLIFASRGHGDGFKCEYLSVDCTLHDGTWGVPEAMIELENDPRQLPYSAWKLLCTRARRRVLIGYYYESLERAQAQISEVATQHPPNETLFALLAPWSTPPRTRTRWRGFFQPLLFKGTQVEALGR